MNSFNKLIVGFVKILPKPVVYIFAQKYIAGLTLDDAEKTVRDLEKSGLCATIDVLGEAVKNTGESSKAKNECLEVLNRIKETGIDSNLSVKLSQLGLNIDAEFCFAQISEICGKAAESGIFIRIDMEDSSLTEKTLEIFKRLRKEYSNVGIVVQAYLKRTSVDVDELNAIPANYRLCKGIYIEPEEIAITEYQAVRDNYLMLLEKMLINGNYVGIATHDTFLVENAIALTEKFKIPKDRFEFQMLFGVREDLRKKIAAMGYKLRVYVPFGEKWYHYSVRRLQENPKIAWYITKSIFTFNK